MARSGKDREERREGKKKRRKKKGRKKRKEKEKEGFAIISTVHRAIPSRARKKRYVLHYDFHAINHLAIVPIEFPNNSWIIREEEQLRAAPIYIYIYTYPHKILPEARVEMASAQAGGH